MKATISTGFLFVALFSIAGPANADNTVGAADLAPELAVPDGPAAPANTTVTSTWIKGAGYNKVLILIDPTEKNFGGRPVLQSGTNNQVIERMRRLAAARGGPKVFMTNETATQVLVDPGQVTGTRLLRPKR